ncbi:unnamed protein product, partial [Heterotrigona itama]
DEEDIKSRKNHVEISKGYTIEYKVPKQFVPAIIGRSGSMIKDIQNKTGTQIHFKEENFECADRICIIKGSYETVHLAEEMIKSVIQNQPIIETYEMFIPQKACGRIIGKGGEIVQQMQAISGAKIVIEHVCGPYDPNGERKIVIKGTAKQITAALAQIQDKIREQKEARAKIEASSATRLPRGKLSPRNTVNTSEQVQSTESLLVSDGLMEVYVSAMENPSQFWVQIVGPGTTALDKLVSEMTTYYDDEENYEIHKLKNITIGQMVAARFSFNKQWYRAEIISTPENDQCEIFFVDYGDREVVNLDSVLELRTDFLRLRLQAVECSMANIKPPNSQLIKLLVSKRYQLLNSLSSMLLDLELPIPASQTSLNNSGFTRSIIFHAKLLLSIVIFSSQYAKLTLLSASQRNSSAIKSLLAIFSGVIVSIRFRSQSSFNPKKECDT